MINIYRVEVSTNGRDSVLEVIDTDYTVDKHLTKLVRTILSNSYSLKYEDEICIYLHIKDLKK